METLRWEILNIHFVTKVPAPGGESCLAEFPQNGTESHGNGGFVRLGEGPCLHVLNTKWPHSWVKWTKRLPLPARFWTILHSVQSVEKSIELLNYNIKVGIEPGHSHIGLNDHCTDHCYFPRKNWGFERGTKMTQCSHNTSWQEINFATWASVWKVPSGTNMKQLASFLYGWPPTTTGKYSFFGIIAARFNCFVCKLV